MSRATSNINRITENKDRISVLDRIVADKVEMLPDEDYEMVKDIKKAILKQVFSIMKGIHVLIVIGKME